MVFVVLVVVGFVLVVRALIMRGVGRQQPARGLAGGGDMGRADQHRVLEETGAGRRRLMIEATVVGTPTPTPARDTRCGGPPARGGSSEKLAADEEIDR